MQAEYKSSKPKSMCLDACLNSIIYSYRSYENIYESIRAGFKPTESDLDNEDFDIFLALNMASKNGDAETFDFIRKYFKCDTWLKNRFVKVSRIDEFNNLIGDGLCNASKKNDEKSIEYFIKDSNLCYDEGLCGAVVGNHIHLVRYFMDKILSNIRPYGGYNENMSGCITHCINKENKDILFLLLPFLEKLTSGNNHILLLYYEIGLIHSRKTKNKDIFDYILELYNLKNDNPKNIYKFE